jgi:hypothetical protein
MGFNARSSCQWKWFQFTHTTTSLDKAFQQLLQLDNRVHPLTPTLSTTKHCIFNTSPKVQLRCVQSGDPGGPMIMLLLSFHCLWNLTNNTTPIILLYMLHTAYTFILHMEAVPSSKLPVDFYQSNGSPIMYLFTVYSSTQRRSKYTPTHTYISLLLVRHVCTYTLHRYIYTQCLLALSNATSD